MAVKGITPKRRGSLLGALLGGAFIVYAGLAICRSFALGVGASSFALGGGTSARPVFGSPIPRIRGRADIGRAACVARAAKTAEECKIEEEDPMNKIKSFGAAGVISYAGWEFAFWTIGGAIGISAFMAAQGHMPDFSNQTDMSAVGGEAFIFINGARFLVPLRLGLALSTAPWIRDNVLNKIFPPDPECVTPGEAEVNEAKA
mmetsp:Transcript_19757/g.54398  ORF Transcript_19757/g.54398 Transcript_19757/m.54398 type:complete len:203 (-) Transcript_19757:165-773(-)|eukprot:CAMPEP_0117585148 /NCGR_PEP_ID=MMETSP0784-20121206/67987_1 /TAXON_ID=39447 /ORGANISM="" /LENGTH=202 /DNA_ID=CAMNT_0005386069 /DNA_START=54 /DNA_END=662 /DNA_ORIENTATION=-